MPIAGPVSITSVPRDEHHHAVHHQGGKLDGALPSAADSQG
jgi:hypothetical protein